MALDQNPNTQHSENLPPRGENLDKVPDMKDSTDIKEATSVRKTAVKKDLDAMDSSQLSTTKGLLDSVALDAFGDEGTDLSAVLLGQADISGNVTKDADRTFDELGQTAQDTRMKKKPESGKQEKGISELLNKDEADITASILGDDISETTSSITTNANGSFQELENTSVKVKKTEVSSNAPKRAIDNRIVATKRTTETNSDQNEIDINSIVERRKLNDDYNQALTNLDAAEKSKDKNASAVSETNKDLSRKLGTTPPLKEGATPAEKEEAEKRAAEKLVDAAREAAKKTGEDPNDPRVLKKVAKTYKYGTDEKRQAIESTFRKAYGEEQGNRVLSKMKSDDFQDQLGVLDAAYTVDRLKKEDPSTLARFKKAENKVAFIREEASKGNTIFQEYIQSQKESLELKAEYLKRTAKEQSQSKEQQIAPSLTQDSYAKLMQAGVNMSKVESMPPEAQVKLDTLVQNGGAKLIGILMEKGSFGEDKFEGKVLGDAWGMSFNYATGDLYLVGRNAEDQMNRGLYKIKPPTLKNFETVLIRAIGGQHQISFIDKMPEQSEDLYRVFTGGMNGEALPQYEEIKRFQNFAILVLGDGAPDRAEEEDRFQKLGILNENGAVNETIVKNFRLATDMYVGAGIDMHNAKGTGSQTSPNFGYKEALILAKHWREGDINWFPDRNALQKLSEKKG